MKTIEVAGAQFCYDEAGEDRDGTLIVLHGGRGIGDHRSELEAYRPLADRYRVIAYDQRGCGRTSLTPPFTFARLADDVNELRKALVGDKRCILLGGSFGGMIALSAAVRHPDAFTHLLLRGTAPSHDMETEALENFKARIHKATSASLRMVEKIFSDQVIDDVELRLIWLALAPLYREQFDPDAALESTRTMFLHAETHNALYRNKEQYDVRESMRGIRIPTFVFCGAKDWICAPSQSKLMASRIPGAELMIVDGANHSVHHEANELVIARIRDFLARHRPMR
jgi:proline iminopeptidase